MGVKDSSTRRVTMICHRAEESGRELTPYTRRTTKLNDNKLRKSIEYRTGGEVSFDLTPWPIIVIAHVAARGSLRSSSACGFQYWSPRSVATFHLDRSRQGRIVWKSKAGLEDSDLLVKYFESQKEVEHHELCKEEQRRSAFLLESMNGSFKTFSTMCACKTTGKCHLMNASERLFLRRPFSTKQEKTFIVVIEMTAYTQVGFNCCVGNSDEASSMSFLL